MRATQRLEKPSARAPRTALAALLGLAAWPLFAAGPGRYVVLDNGLRLFLYEKPGVPLVHIVTGFDVGAKDESGETSGLVHLLEHCILFRGTATRSAGQVEADIRRHGAYFNGNTGPDLAVFEISLPAGSADFGLRNQKDILFDLALSQADIDREKEVILEEMSQMEDDPERSAIDLVLQELFPGHPYGRSLYGRRETIAAATADGLAAFYRRHFAADRCAMAVVGDFDPVDMEARVRAVFGGLPRTGSDPETFPMAAPLRKISRRRLERDVRGGYLFIGFAGPDYNSPDQFAMNVLVEALGGGVNPLLGSRLRGLRVSVQGVTMSYLAMRFGGAAVVAVRADPADLPAVERAALAWLKRSGGESYSKKDFFDAEAEMAAFDYLEMAKNQIRYAVGQAEESGLRLAGSLVRHMLLNTRSDRGGYLEGIAKVDSGDLRRVAGRYLGRGEPAVVTIVPAKREGTR